MISRTGDQDALLVHAYKLLARPTRTILEFGEEEADGHGEDSMVDLFLSFFLFFLRCKLARIVVLMTLVGPEDWQN